MRILLFFSIQLTFFISSVAQEPAIELSDEKAVEIFEVIKQEYDQYDSHKFNFDILVQSPDYDDSSFKAELIQSGDKFSLDMDDRMIISDEETVWVYFKERNELQINDADFDEDSGVITPSDLFSLHTSGNYIFMLSNSYMKGTHTVSEIECKPISSDSEFFKIRIVIDETLKQPLEAIIFSKDGSRMTMKMKDHLKGFKCTDDTFSFDESAFEGILVEDLRF